MLKVRSLSAVVCTVLVLLACGAVAQAATSFQQKVSVPGMPLGYRVTLESAAGDSCITQSTNPTTVQDATSVACLYNTAPAHTDNGFIRRFELAADHALAGQHEVSSVEVGIQEATGAGGDQPGAINLYSIPIGAGFTYANMTAIGTTPLNISNQALTLLLVNVSGTLDASASDLVVEFFVPDGLAENNLLFAGANSAGQIAPSYIAAAGCGAPNPTNLANFGFGNVHWVQTVCLGPTGPVPALGPLGALLMIVALGGGSAYIARRRQA
jgi:hypothetical protein